MKKVLYTKYNSLRRTEFQIKTSIIETDGKRCVLKAAMNDMAAGQLDAMKKNYELIKDMYNDIEVIPYNETEDGLCFDFIKGKDMLCDIDFVHDDMDKIIKTISEKIETILDINDDLKKKFELSKEFKEMFPGCYPKDEIAFKVANVDSILSNFVEALGKLWCIDYEWVFDFEIPKGYIIYRTLLYLYTEKAELLKDRIRFEDFIRSFSLDRGSIHIYQKMEECFQQYVHGKDRRYIYTNNYLKKTTGLKKLTDDNASLQKFAAQKDEQIEKLEKEVEELKESIDLKNQHIDNLESMISRQSANIKDLKHAVKNPFYGVGFASKKIYNRLMFKFGSEEWKEEQRVGKYKYKYRDLMLEQKSDYETWINEVESKETYDEKFAYNPKISVVVPVYNVLDKHLVPCIESVINQIYDNWELCLSDDNSTWPNVKETLKRYESDDRIKVVYRQENGHISRATNSAIEVATGEFVAFMDCDDTLAPQALYEVVKKLNENRELDFIYSDEDKIDEDGGNRNMPHFKPDWSPDTFMSHMYTNHLGVYRKSLIDEVGGLRPGFEGSQDYDFTLRFTEKTNRVAHIPKILYHWRVREESTAGDIGAKPYVLEAASKAKREAMERRGIPAKVEEVVGTFQFRINYDVVDEPLVSIIIPSKDNYDVLEQCISTLTAATEYKRYEIILVDNGSCDEQKALYEKLAERYSINYIYEKQDFNFSAMCNKGAAHAKGEYYLFLNDDIEIINEIWLTRMLGHAQQKHIGAVGAKLLYPDGETIQHDGVINVKNGPMHALAGLKDDIIHYFGRNKLEYNYLAVTAACLLVNAEKFKETGGFDEELAVAYNDVDLCFKLYEKGYYNVVRNDAVLIHHESVSRGSDLEDDTKFKRLEIERNKLYDRHPKLMTDPFYNINLTQTDTNFAYNYYDDEKDYCDIVEEKAIEKYSDKALTNIDILMVLKNIYIAGWGFIKGYDKNNDTDIKLCFYNDEKSYIATTRKVYRPDVARANREEKDVEFTGFICEFPKVKLPKGKYHIDVICRKERVSTEKSIDV